MEMAKKKITPYGEIESYTKRRGVVLTGFDKLNDKDLDVLNDIAYPEDLDNKRSFRKKKSTKPKPKRCSCKKK